MKKVILLITVLFVSVISTACINNLAVQELNSKAKAYMEAGEIEKAICRLRSSIDLDTNVFETHYNLGVALISAKQYEEAEKSLENAIKLKPDFADAYYSLAVAQEEKAYEKINKKDDLSNNDKEEASEIDEQTEETTVSPQDNAELTLEEKTEIAEDLSSAIENYNKYLTKKPEAEDKDKIENQVNTLNEDLKKYSQEEAPAVQ